jgi:hypothetical protein
MMAKNNVRILPEISAYYNEGKEASRLSQGVGLLEFARMQEILIRAGAAALHCGRRASSSVRIFIDSIVASGGFMHVHDLPAPVGFNQYPALVVCPVADSAFLRGRQHEGVTDDSGILKKLQARLH